MPKTVDHGQRRALIVEGLVRVAGHNGLHAVTMRSIADESGVSLRLVQYYFQNKAQLMRAALQHLAEQSNQRWSQRIANLPKPESSRALVEAFLAEALPTDERSRVFHLVGTSYAVLAMTDSELADQPFIAGLNHLEEQLAGILRLAQGRGELPSELDASCEAARLVAINHGIGTTVLAGHRSIEYAMAVLTYHLNQLFARS